MKKIFAIVMLLVVLMAVMSGCNRQIIDTTWRFSKAVVFTSEGVLADGKVESWKDFDNSDMVQVKIDGKTYLTYSSNVILIAE